LAPIRRDLSSPIPWRRSLRASRARRAAQARRRRRVFRGRAGLLIAVALSAIASAGALAQGTGRQPRGLEQAGARGGAVRALQQALGINADGVFGPRTRAAVMRFQRAHGLQVDGIAGPVTLTALGLATAAPAAASASTSSAPDATLEQIAQCESGGDPTAVSADGRYRGKYQFSRATWRDLGGSGDPAAAPESVQDAMAVKLLASRGTTPWPVCGS
jgi:Transglycosylase-like domain/Putative peptidoglycan binding domain